MVTKALENRSNCPKADLSGLWNFTFLPGGTKQKIDPKKLTFDSFASVPGCFDLMPAYYLKRGTGVYQRNVCGGGLMELVSEGLGLRGTVFWDGRQIAEIDTAFSRRVIRFDAGKTGTHSLVFAVNNEFDDSPSSMFYRNYDFYAHGGLFRGVSLAPAEKILKEEWKIITTDLKKGEVQISVKVSGAAKKSQAEIRFDGQKEVQILPLKNGIGTGTFKVPLPKVWSPESPNLHQAEMTIGGVVFNTTFGLRTVECKKGKLYLNGKPLKLVGCNRHDSFPDFGYAIPEELQLRDLQLLKRAGMNCLRGCHYPQSERFLNLCDRMGMLVWDESLGWGNAETSLVDPDFQKKQVRETRNMAIQSINHPCIIIWGFLNEANTTVETARPIVKMLADALHEVDPSRPVSCANYRLRKDLCLDIVDIISFNIYPCWYTPDQDQFINRDVIHDQLADLAKFTSEMKYKNKPLIISEIGAEAIPGIYGGQRNSEEYQADLLETAVQDILKLDRYTGIFIWQFCDARTFISNNSQNTSGGFNCKGIVDRYRNPKIAWRRLSTMLNKREEGKMRKDSEPLPALIKKQTQKERNRNMAVIFTRQ